MSNGMVRFILVGPNKGKTIGFSKDHTGEARYKFRNGVMEVHPSRVNGRLIKFLKGTYSAVLEGELDNGFDNDAPDGNDSSGSENVSSDLGTEQVEPAAEDAIQLSGNDDAKGGKEKRAAKGRGSSSKSAG